MHKERILWFAAVVVAIVLGFFGRSVFSKQSGSVDFQPLREKSGNYSFISPLLTCQLSEKIAFPNLKPLAMAFQGVIDDALAIGNAEKVSVYYRDLNTGFWTGVGENDGYEPASLLKVPMMIAYEKSVEDGENSFQKSLVYNGTDYNVGENIKPEQAITIGKPYSALAMIRSMIVNSDNNAYLALYHAVDTKALIAAYTDLGLTVSHDNEVNTISPKQYSLFLRVLYNASYIDREDSEAALKLLSESTFDSGLASSLPKSVQIADKFGERGLPDGSKELHDCGVVYYPSRPYILCVMTHGSDIARLSETISAISKASYDFVAKNN